MGRDGNNSAPLMRAAWDNGDLRTPLKITRSKQLARTSVLLGISLVQSYCAICQTQSNTTASVIAFLWCSVRRSKILPEGGKVPKEEMAILATQLRTVIEYARSTGGSIMGRDDAARSLWGAVYERLSEGLPGLLGAATSRAEAQEFCGCQPCMPFSIVVSPFALNICGRR